MKQGSRVNTLLIELMIVIFFFMLASTIMVEIFAGARQCSRLAENRSAALLEAQNLAETIYGGKPAEEVLAERGFREKEGFWQLEKDGYLLRVDCMTEILDSGKVESCTIEAVDSDTLLFSVPCDRYIPEGGTGL